MTCDHCTSVRPLYFLKNILFFILCKSEYFTVRYMYPCIACIIYVCNTDTQIKQLVCNQYHAGTVEPENTGPWQNRILSISDGSFGPLRSISLLELNHWENRTIRLIPGPSGILRLHCTCIGHKVYMYTLPAFILSYENLPIHFSRPALSTPQRTSYTTLLNRSFRTQ